MVRLIAFVRIQWTHPWAGPTLICLALFAILFALAGETVNAPFVYTTPK